MRRGQSQYIFVYKVLARLLTVQHLQRSLDIIVIGTLSKNSTDLVKKVLYLNDRFQKLIDKSEIKKFLLVYSRYLFIKSKFVYSVSYILLQAKLRRSQRMSGKLTKHLPSCRRFRELIPKCIIMF
jgi:hypothetical protein